MNSDNTNKWRIRIATLSIFLLGAVAGAFALNAYNLWFSNHAPPTRQQRFERITKDLQLSEPQGQEMQAIFNETREKMQALRTEGQPKMDAIREEADGKLQKLMSPEQWDKFVKMRDEKKREHERSERK